MHSDIVGTVLVPVSFCWSVSLFFSTSPCFCFADIDYCVCMRTEGQFSKCYSSAQRGQAEKNFSLPAVITKR